jgi:hypothetical protein
VVEMDNFLSYSKQECLGEYALAIKRDLFTPIGGAHFNISTYQRSLSSKSYIEMWEEKVFETLAETKKNPKARELYNKILRYARRCIEYANNDQVLKDNESRGVDMERILYIKTTMQRVKERLNQLQEI